MNLAGGNPTVYGYVHNTLTELDPLGLAKCGTNLTRKDKHIEKGHINRKLSPHKGQYKKPSQVKKLENRTMNSPDKVTIQDNGRVLFEKQYGRVIGTKGEIIPWL